MSYQAIVCRLENVRSHPNAERLKLAEAAGVQVIVGLDNYEGQLGILFPDEGALSPEMMRNNNLYSQKDLNLDPTKSGYFEKNGRIRAQKLRGERSYGFWTELSSVYWTEVDTSTLEEGFGFTQLNGKLVCEKYINPATRQGAQRDQKSKSLATKVRKRFEQLKEHFDTKHLDHEIEKIPKGSIIYLSEKKHGASARTGNIYGKLNLTKRQALWNKYFWWLKKAKPKREYQIVSGARRRVLNPDQTRDKGYYFGKTFRIDIHNSIKRAGLPRGITLFYEIVGFDEKGSPIQGGQSIEKIKDKKLRKEVKAIYGEKMIYSYGCVADDPVPEYRYNIFVYRATITNIDGDVFELPWPQVQSLCSELNVNLYPSIQTVPELEPAFIYAGKDDLLKRVEGYLDVPDTTDPKHVSEGVCVRIETPGGRTYILKKKGWIFKLLEGAVKEDPNIIDIEEVEDLEREDCNGDK